MPEPVHRCDPSRPRRRFRVVLIALAIVTLACSQASDEASPSTAPGSESNRGTVRLVTHDSFALSDDVVAEFERESGYRLEIVQSGDAVDVVNKAVLSAGRPEGDVLFGIDDNTLRVAFDAGIFTPYRSPLLNVVDDRFELDPEARVTPIDHGHVCVNYDVEAYRASGIEPPRTFEDLASPAYRNQLVVQNPASSTPGLAFLLATVSRYGEDGWRDYWRRLRANGVEVVDSWSQAYSSRFSGGSGEGDRPLVVSYGSSPPYEVLNAGTDLTEAPTAVVADTCYRQVEFAGLLAGATNPEGGRALIDFLLGQRAQEDIPLQMFVFPVRTGTPLPEVFERFTTVPDEPLSLPPERVGSERERWVREWTDTVLR